MASSQGHRSSSVSGVPDDIFSMFAGGWKSSPSAYGTPSRSASRGPIVVLPVPATPMITTTWGVRRSFIASCLAVFIDIGPSFTSLKPIRSDEFKSL
jgi:hypothetical protein